MSTEQTWQTESTSLEATLKLAEGVGQRLKGGEIIELASDLGGGKTTFVRGLAQGAGSQDVVRSPSFTLSNQYQAGGLTINHLDFYRLDEPGIMREELTEIIGDPNNVVIVEWADIIADVLPTNRLAIEIKVTGELSRQFIFSFPAKLKHLIPDNT